MQLRALKGSDGVIIEKCPTYDAKPIHDDALPANAVSLAQSLRRYRRKADRGANGRASDNSEYGL